MNEREIDNFRQSGALKKYQDYIAQQNQALKQAEYDKFLKRQAEIQEIEAQIRRLELKLEILHERLLFLRRV